MKNYLFIDTPITTMKRLNPIFATLLILAAFLSQSCNIIPTTSVGLSVDILELADVAMQSYIDDGKLSGITTLVLKDGQVAHQGTFGLAEISEERAMTEDAIFRIYSMSKPITAAALMMLLNGGELNGESILSQTAVLI